MRKYRCDNTPPICPWCQDKNRKTDLSFSIVDDDFGQYVPQSKIKFCPFCGRRIN